MRKYFIKTKAGYTIIETMISISLFIVVVMVGMESLLNANVVHQKSQDMSSIIDNMNFIMEDMSRNIRTGYNYHCITIGEDIYTSNLSSPKSGASCWGIAFESARGDTSDPNDQWVYVINASHNVLKSEVGASGASSFMQLNPDLEVVMDAVSGFSVLGAEAPSDTQQPFANIRLVGKITYKSVITSFALQSSVSQRLVDR
ncbi:MAG: hypothetical protein KBC06_02050 [Candidatus Pacebacteria bacterium]|nr:hypothetical protein [Candidatus Paceibacterota bacterium]